MSNTSLLFRGKPDTRTGDLSSIDFGISDISEIMYIIKLNWNILKERELAEDVREKRRVAQLQPSPELILLVGALSLNLSRMV